MEFAAAVCLTLSIYVFVPLIIGTAIGGVMVAADRRIRKNPPAEPEYQPDLKVSFSKSNSSKYLLINLLIIGK